MSFTTSPFKSSSQNPSSPLAKVKLPHRLSLSDGNYDAASLKAQNIQLSYFRTNQVVVSFNPVNQSLVLYEYDANGVSRPVLAEDLAQLRALNANVVFPSCWCPAAFTGEYCETIIFTMSPLANAEYENPGKLALRCAASQPKLRLFGCGFFIPIQQLTSQGALGNPLRIPAPGRTNAVTSSSSSLLNALDESFVGTSKRKFEVQPNGSPKKSRVLAPDSDTDFSPPTPLFSARKKPLFVHIAQDTMFKAAFLQKGSLRGTSTMEEFFQGTATFPAPSLRALEEAYTSGRGISLQDFRYLTDYCLECGKLFRRLAHDKHLCFEVSQTQPRRMRIPKTEKGKEKARRPSSDIFTISDVSASNQSFILVLSVIAEYDRQPKDKGGHHGSTVCVTIRPSGGALPIAIAKTNNFPSTNTVARLHTAVPAASAASLISFDRCRASKLDFVVSRTADPFPGNVLLEAERRYGAQLVQNGVDKLSIFCGWHRSRNNPRYHYTLWGYNAAGWMAFTVEMEAGTQGIDFAYGQLEWNIWLARAGGNLAMLRAKHFFDPADHVEAGISWEGTTAGVDTLWRLLPPSYPVLFPALNHSADNPVTCGYTTIIQVMHEYSFFCSARFLDGDDVSLSEERGYLYYPETAKDHPARV
ncbi:hypothetical protein IW262DRAFT_1292836 [Armillaria fumosa]|nr:hypothetical protein IW262DRAFT_1292836 [Armillaria fumosa]